MIRHNKKKLTLISELGWSMKTISDSSPSNKTLTVFSPNSSSVRKNAKESRKRKKRMNGGEEAEKIFHEQNN